jgi:hypothetical protein
MAQSNVSGSFKTLINRLSRSSRNRGHKDKTVEKETKTLSPISSLRSIGSISPTSSIDPIIPVSPTSPIGCVSSIMDPDTNVSFATMIMEDSDETGSCTGNDYFTKTSGIRYLDTKSKPDPKENKEKNKAKNKKQKEIENEKQKGKKKKKEKSKSVLKELREKISNLINKKIKKSTLSAPTSPKTREVDPDSSVSFVSVNDLDESNVNQSNIRYLDSHKSKSDSEAKSTSKITGKTTDDVINIDTSNSAVRYEMDMSHDQEIPLWKETTMKKYPTPLQKIFVQEPKDKKEIFTINTSFAKTPKGIQIDLYDIDYEDYECQRPEKQIDISEMVSHKSVSCGLESLMTYKDSRDDTEFIYVC